MTQLDAAPQQGTPPARSADFVEALARGLDVLATFEPSSLTLTVTEVAARTGLARPTARRLLMTLTRLGYVQVLDGAYSLTTQVLRLSTAGIRAEGLWETAKPHLLSLVTKTNESSSMSQLDGCDIIYTARVQVPKIIALAVVIGTRFPAAATSMGHVLLAGLSAEELAATLELSSQSGVVPHVIHTKSALLESLSEIRERGWALSDEELSIGIRSVAVPIRDSAGRTAAAMNVTVHATQTSIEQLTTEYLPLLIETADVVSAQWAGINSDQPAKPD